MAFYKLIPTKATTASILLKTLRSNGLAGDDAHILPSNEIHPEHVVLRQDTRVTELDKLVSSLSVGNAPMVGKCLKVETTPVRTNSHMNNRSTTQHGPACVPA